jgi:hypothetical protein
LLCIVEHCKIDFIFGGPTDPSPPRGRAGPKSALSCDTEVERNDLNQRGRNLARQRRFVTQNFHGDTAGKSPRLMLPVTVTSFERIPRRHASDE